MLPSSDLFDLHALEQAIANTRFAGHVLYLPSVGSTSTLALEAAQAAGASPIEPRVWIAGEQTAGRGRGGHSWHSAPGDGLYLSALVAPRISVLHAMQLSLLTGLAAQSAILSAAGLHADIRWPNDLLVSGRKCAGILVETSLSSGASREPASLRYAVIGIGINANHSGFPPELLSLATSLRLASGARVSLEQLASALLVALDRELSLLAPDGSSTRQLLARFAAASSWVSGRSVRVGGLDGYTGVTAGLNENGFLLVDGDDGVQHTVLSGGVRDRDEI